ncbi:hypothetical protein AVEN_6830-1 [Araneus ventricosus]|uniref:Uncharacterized protein n=1 Tax=Araneus ventricosus TaxID=182803 RepID=A0A4Y2R2C3_ARAVE|nr:hypothetical protein AVEN_6830-1 [Araneus ventricosus]
MARISAVRNFRYSLRQSASTKPINEVLRRVTPSPSQRAKRILVHAVFAPIFAPRDETHKPSTAHAAVPDDCQRCLVRSSAVPPVHPRKTSCHQPEFTIFAVCS